MIHFNRISIFAALLVITPPIFSRENADSTRLKLHAGAVFSINSNGIASIPAFSLDKPAVIASPALSVAWFSYDPNLAYGFDGRPWFIDNWLHVRLISRSKFELRTGMNISSYCSKYLVPDGEVLHVERYFTFELATTFRFNPKTTLLVQYWSDNGQEKESLKGHYFNLYGERTDIPLGKKLQLTTDLQLFYIDYTGKNDGLFVSPRIAFTVGNIPLSLFWQATQAIASNVEPFPRFKWNVGIAWTVHS